LADGDALGSGELEVPAANADAAADASPGDVASLVAPPADNNSGAALADGDAHSSGQLKATDDADVAADASLADEVKFDWQPVSIRIHLYYEFTCL